MQHQNQSQSQFQNQNQYQNQNQHQKLSQNLPNNRHPKTVRRVPLFGV